MCVRACHMCACKCNVSVCHVFDCSGVFFFFIVNNKTGACFLQFSHFLTHILAVYPDAKQST